MGLAISSRRRRDIIDDRSSLLSFKSHLIIPSNNIITHNWSDNTSPCTWVGVTCALRHQRVTALNLSDMALAGTISPHLGNLSFLTSLDLSFNTFSGSLPKQLARLGRLVYVSLMNNHFANEMPSWIDNFQKLEYLNLGNNSFTGPIPASIGNIQNLQSLYLHNNMLQGSIPKEIANLSQLSVLKLTGNQLQGSIPSTIFNMSSLSGLDLNYNYKLSGSLPVDLCNHLPLLQILALSANQLEGELPSKYLFKCAELRILALSINKFGGSIPREIGNLTMLEEVYFNDNLLEGMSGTVPSFVQPSEKYEDLFSEDELMTLEPPINATPISQAKVPTPGKAGSTPADKRRFSQASGSLAPSPETRSSKRVILPQSPSILQEIQQFHRLTEGQIPLEVISGWSKLKTSDAIRAMLYSSGENLFHQLRIGNQLVAATRGDMKLKEDLKQAKSDLEVVEGERKKLADANKKLKSEISVVTKEKEKFCRLVSAQDKEKEELVAAHATEVGELKVQVDVLQTSARKMKEVLPERYKLGFAKGVNDYLKATWKVMPNLDWSLLGEDVVKEVEKFKAEAAKVEDVGSKDTAMPPVTQKDTAERTPTSKTVVETPASAVEVTPGESIKKIDPVEDSHSSEATKDTPSA